MVLCHLWRPPAHRRFFETRYAGFSSKLAHCGQCWEPIEEDTDDESVCLSCSAQWKSCIVFASAVSWNLADRNRAWLWTTPWTNSHTAKMLCSIWGIDPWCGCSCIYRKHYRLINLLNYFRCITTFFDHDTSTSRTHFVNFAAFTVSMTFNLA